MMQEGQKKLDPRARYDAKNTRRIAIKLNIGTDSDILAKLDALENKQGYIKSLIRKDLIKEGE